MKRIAKRRGLAALCLAAIFLLTGCGKDNGVGGVAGDAGKAVIAANQAMAQKLDFSQEPGLSGRPTRLDRKAPWADPRGGRNGPGGLCRLSFCRGRSASYGQPKPVASREAQCQDRLFKVTDGIYQLRGFDLGNMTLIEGKTGWIVVDPLTCRESAAFSFAFAKSTWVKSRFRQ
jgi:hypothetical protein